MREDLNAVNHALRELVRLQMAGELAPDEAWRERRQMLEAVEESWDTLAPPDESADGVAVHGVAPDEPALHDSSSGRDASRTGAGGEFSVTAARAGDWLSGLTGRIIRRSATGALPVAGLLFILAILTFLYVGSL